MISTAFPNCQFLSYMLKNSNLIFICSCRMVSTMHQKYTVVSKLLILTVVLSRDTKFHNLGAALENAVYFFCVSSSCSCLFVFNENHRFGLGKSRKSSNSVAFTFHDEKR
jgi:hypothetical protein